TMEYMHIWFLGMPFIAIPMMGNNALRATGDATSPGIIMAIGSMANLVLDPLLIFGLAGFPALGIAGAAYATLIGRAFALFASLGILGFRKKMLTFEKPQLKLLLQSWGKLLYIGIPAAMTGVLGPVTMAIIIRLVAQYGTEAVAAVSAGAKIDSLTIMVLASMGSVVMPFVGQNWGAGKMDRIREAHRWVYKFCIGWGVLMYAVVVIFAHPIAQQFGKEERVVELIVLYLYITSTGLGLEGLWRIVSGAFNGMHQPIHSAMLNMVCLIVITLPTAAIGSVMYGLEGLFIGLAAGKLLSGLVGIGWANYLHGRLEEKVNMQVVPAV
ncbi:MAG: MATE family efflux transporter, partial [Phycisphaeraceae bacterium JB051]